MSEVAKTSNIDISISFDDQKIPIDIVWKSDDQAGNTPVSCKGMLLSFLDREHLDTLKIDLWTKDMQVAEMDRFVFHTLRAMADTYQRATQNNALANDMQRFVQYFGERTEILKPEE